MGFRFRKSKSFGPFKVNLSKSGIGWSVGGKGFRFTKRADGKTQNTYSIPGTGISYVDVKGKSNNTPGHTNLHNDNLDNSFNGSSGGGKKRPPKWLLIVLGILAYLILFANFSKLIGTVTLLGGAFMGYRLFNKNSAFRTRNLPVKILVGLGLSVFMFLFGLGGLLANPSANVDTTKQISQSNTQVAADDAKKKADEEAALKADQEAKLKAQQEADAMAAQEAKQKAEQEAAAKAAQEQAAKDAAAAAAVASTQTSSSSSASTSAQQTSPTAGVKVWLSATGTKYHRINNCGKMDPSKARLVNLDDIRGQYEPCSKCNPPQ